MLNLALTVIDPVINDIQVSNNLLIEKYGGLAVSLTFQESVSETASGEPIMKTKVFPVSCTSSFDDCRSNRFQDLVPNSKHRSIGYFEQIGDAARNAIEEGRAKRGSLFVYDIPVRLVVWLNIPKMNLNGDQATACNIAGMVLMKLQKALYRPNGFEFPADVYPNSNVQMIFQAQEAKDANRIFGKYSYGDLTKFMLFPYDWFSLRYLVRVRISANCYDAFTIGTPENCAASQ